MDNIKNLNNWQLFIDGNLFVGVARSEIGEFTFMLDDYIEKRWRHTPMAENGRLIQSTQWCIEKGKKMYKFAIENYLNNVYAYVEGGDITISYYIPNDYDDREKRLIGWIELKNSNAFIGDNPFGVFGRKNAKSCILIGVREENTTTLYTRKVLTTSVV